MSDEIKQPLIQTFTCEICIEPTLLTHQFRHTNNCVHNICFTCIAGHIEAKIDENVSTIQCPELDCGKILIPLECEAIIPRAVMVKWCDCLCKLCVSAYSSCYCPYRDCSELILNECNEATTKCACPRCKRLVCYACKVPWHAGFWCSETSQERDANDLLFGVLIEKMNWTRCPQCGTPVELTGGCFTVKCRCGTQFCHYSERIIENFSCPMIIMQVLIMIFCLAVIFIMATRGN